MYNNNNIFHHVAHIYLLLRHNLCNSGQTRIEIFLFFLALCFVLRVHNIMK